MIHGTFTENILMFYNTIHNHKGLYFTLITIITLLCVCGPHLVILSGHMVAVIQFRL